MSKSRIAVLPAFNSCGVIMTPDDKHSGRYGAGSANLIEGVTALEFSLTQGDGVVETRAYCLADLRRTEPCRNPRCEHGGLELHVALRISTPGENYFYCQGYERGVDGTPNARPCTNHFKLTLLHIEGDFVSPAGDR